MFKEGDLVEVKSNYMTNSFKNRVGKVIFEGVSDVAVDWGVGFHGHSLCGKIKNKTGWFMIKNQIEICEIAKKSNREVY